MPPLVVFSWPYCLLFLAVMYWAFAPEFRIISRQTEPSTSPQDAGSKRVISAKRCGIPADGTLAAIKNAAHIAEPWPIARLPPMIVARPAQNKPGHGHLTT
jgi:hypothetical protein